MSEERAFYLNHRWPIYPKDIAKNFDLTVLRSHIKQAKEDRERFSKNNSNMS